MSQTTYSKKTRTTRASQIQLTKMIDFFNINKGLAEGKIQALHGKDEAKKKWTELMNELNSLHGATKTVEQWQVVWRDLKSRTSIKAKDLRKAKALTGNKAIIQSELTELELRIIGIIGAEYVEGSKYCAENIPEEENLIEELERGNNAVLSAIPQIISICADNSQETFQDSENANSFDDNFNNNNDENSIMNDCLLSNALEHNAVIEIEDSDSLNSVGSRKSKKAPKIISFKNNRNIPYPVPSKPAEQSNNSMENIHEPSTSSRKFNRITSKQLHASRENFQFIAQKQANAEFMHAECAKIQAEACKMNALAMSKIADAVQKMADTAAEQAVNDSKRIEVFEKLTKILENLLPSYIQE